MARTVVLRPVTGSSDPVYAQQPKGDDMSSVPLARLHCGSVPLVPLDIDLHTQGPGLSLYYSKKEKGKEILGHPSRGLREQCSMRYPFLP